MKTPRTAPRALPPVQIDGAAGEGGGQILRSSLALSLVTGRAFRAVNIRAGRSKPGLLRQHLTAMRAATEISGAATDGALIGSGELVFRPGAVRAGDYRFAVGTAGSTTLVLQTILPALALADAPSRVVIEGGTHNPFSPSFDFLARTFLPVFNRAGPTAAARLCRAGFYPAGGGSIEVDITPAARFIPVELLSRGEEGGRRAVAHVAGVPASVAERAFAQVDKRLRWGRAACEIVEHPDKPGQGFVLTGEVASGAHTEVFTGFGERGIRAEAVADQMVDQVRTYLSSGHPVGEHMTDQILLLLALAGGGAFRCAGLSPHAQTNMRVIESFLPVHFRVIPLEGGGVEVVLDADADHFPAP